MKFGENLYSLRKSSKMSQEKLAEKVGVSRQSVSKWETGESYPEMDNIMKLCNIFNCKINDLVHEDMADIDSLDEDIKVSVVKLNEAKQKKMKGLSKAIYIIAKIGKILVTIPIGVIIVLSLLFPFFMKDFKYEDNKISFGRFSKDEIEIIENEGIKLNGSLMEDGPDKASIIKIKDALDNNSKTNLIIYFYLTDVLLIAYLILLRMVFKDLEKLFMEIYNGDTPFTLINVRMMKKIAFTMIATIIVSNIGAGVLDLMINNMSDVGIDLKDCIQILFLFSMAYIFEYGYELQKDSNGKMYGKEGEEGEK
ncbi:MAG: helix-turn-helix transcriptional regulator [Clostridia bacterium]|nr:helix-turn-helix transcriptional regulator [Clostridia bacterium]